MAQNLEDKDKREKTSIYISTKVLRHALSKIEMDKFKYPSFTKVIESFLFEEYKEYLSKEERERLEKEGVGVLARMIKEENENANNQNEPHSEGQKDK